MMALDLFAGAGGATQGLSDAGFRVLAAIEQNEDAAATLARNHPNTVVLATDIEEVCPKSLRSDLGLCPQDLTLLTACPPCQSFSTLGSGNADDPRNGLVAETWRFVREFRPAAVLIENVPGLASDMQWTASKRQLRAAGYRLSSWIVDAADFGVPQRRRRLIAVAVRRHLVEFPDDLCDLVPPSLISDTAHASDVIAQAGPIDGSEDEWHRARTPTSAVLERIRAIPPGGQSLRPAASTATGLPQAAEPERASERYESLRPDPRRRTCANDDYSLHHSLVRAVHSSNRRSRDQPP